MRSKLFFSLHSGVAYISALYVAEFYDYCAVVLDTIDCSDGRHGLEIAPHGAARAFRVAKIGECVRVFRHIAAQLSPAGWRRWLLRLSIASTSA